MAMAVNKINERILKDLHRAKRQTKPTHNLCAVPPGTSIKLNGTSDSVNSVSSVLKQD